MLATYPWRPICVSALPKAEKLCDLIAEAKNDRIKFYEAAWEYVKKWDDFLPKHVYYDLSLKKMIAQLSSEAEFRIGEFYSDPKFRYGR